MARPIHRFRGGGAATWVLLLLPTAACFANLQDWLFLPCGPEPHPEVAAASAASIVPGQVPSTFKPIAVPAGQEPPAPPTWRRVAFPHMDHDRLNPDPKGSKGGSYAWYATLLTPPAWAVELDLVLDLGMIDDADAVHVNGVRVAGTGDMRNNTGSAWNRPRRYRVPKERLAVRAPDPAAWDAWLRNLEAGAGQAPPPAPTAEPDRIMVHVNDFGGRGGMLGFPSLGWALVPADGAWAFRSLGAASQVFADRGDPNRLVRLAIVEAKAAGPVETTGTAVLSVTNPPVAVRIPDADWRKRSPGKGSMCLYSVRVDLPETARAALRGGGDETPLLDFGAVFDVAAVFVGGERIARLGRFPHGSESAFLQTGKRLRCRLPSHLIPEVGPLDIGVLVYAEGGRGGLPGIPALVAPLRPEEAGLSAGGAGVPDATLGPVVSEGPQFYFQPLVLDALEAVDARTAELDYAAAVKLLDAVEGRLPGGEPDHPHAASREAQVSSKRIHLLWQSFLDGTVTQDPRPEMQERLRTLTREQPFESLSLEAMQSLAVAFPASLPEAGDAPPPVRRLVPDRQTRGDWVAQYGRGGFVLSAAMQIGDLFGGCDGKPPVWLSVPGGRDAVRCWLDPKSGWRIADPRALLPPLPTATELERRGPGAVGPDNWLPGAKIRTAAWWDDHGEVRPGDDLGPDLFVHVDVPDGRFLLSLYLQDPDWSDTEHPRMGSILVLDDVEPVGRFRRVTHVATAPEPERPPPGSGRPLAVAWSGRTGEGIYERFVVRGPRRLALRVSKHRAACVAVSGVFLDPLSADGPEEFDRDTLRSSLATLLADAMAGKDDSEDTWCMVGDLGTLDPEPGTTARWLAAALRKENAIRGVERFAGRSFRKGVPIRWTFLAHQRVVEVSRTHRDQVDTMEALTRMMGNRHQTGVLTTPFRRWAFDAWEARGLPRTEGYLIRRRGAGLPDPSLPTKPTDGGTVGD